MTPPAALLALLFTLLGQESPAAVEPPSAGGVPAAPGTATADPHQLFTEANRLFNAARTEADLRRSVEDYRALLGRGLGNGRLHYNLGCAHLRLKETGPAILSLRRALLYLPDDQRAAATLAYARKQVVDEFPEEAEGRALRAVFFWHYRTPFSARLWAALGANLVFWSLLLAWAFVRLPFHRTALWGSLLVGLLLSGSLLLETLSRRGEEAVLVAPRTEVRTGNGAGYDLVFSKPVHSGVEVRVLSTRGNWKLLEFPSGVRGWTLGSAVEAVVPRSS